MTLSMTPRLHALDVSTRVTVLRAPFPNVCTVRFGKNFSLNGTLIAGKKRLELTATFLESHKDGLQKVVFERPLASPHHILAHASYVFNTPIWKYEGFFNPMEKIPPH